MKFKIIGSGGCVSIPRPLCMCNVCQEARKKGIPYKRHGASLYVEDIHLLIDTPEDIVDALNEQNIQNIDYIAFSHQDPDHIFGMRVIEQLRLNWLKVSIGKMCSSPINLLASQGVMNDIEKFQTKFGSVLGYYEKMKLIKKEMITESKTFGDIKMTLIPVNQEHTVSVFVFESHHKKLIYAPCDVKPFPQDAIFDHADVLIIGNTVLGDVLKGGFVLDHDNPLRQELFTLFEIEQLKSKYSIAKVVMTHIEEDWGKGYDDYLELEKQYEGISFAYDGLTIEL